MTWMTVAAAAKIHSEIKVAAPWSKLRYEVNPSDASTARVTLVMSNPTHGNTVTMEASESTVAAKFISDAQRELKSRGRATARRIAQESDMD